MFAGLLRRRIFNIQILSFSGGSPHGHHEPSRSSATPQPRGVNCEGGRDGAVFQEWDWGCAQHTRDTRVIWRLRTQ